MLVLVIPRIPCKLTGYESMPRRLRAHARHDLTRFNPDDQ
jgi:hypothetical protein